MLTRGYFDNVGLIADVIMATEVITIGDIQNSTVWCGSGRDRNDLSVRDAKAVGFTVNLSPTESSLVKIHGLVPLSSFPGL